MSPASPLEHTGGLRGSLRAAVSLEAALLAFVGSGLYKSLPVLRSFPIDWTVFTGLLVTVGSGLLLLRLRSRFGAEQLLAVSLTYVWLAYSALSILWSSGGETAMRRLSTGLPLVALTFGASVLVASDPARVRRLLALIPVLALLAFVSTIQVVTRRSYQEAQDLAAANYIMRGIAMSLGAMVLVARVLAARDRMAVRALLLLGAAGLGLGVIIAGSRQALGALAAGGLVALFFAARRGMWRGAALTVGVAGLVGVGGAVLLGRAGISLATIDRLMLLVTTASGGSSFNERAAFVETSLAGFLQSPWFGQGFASFGSYHGNNPSVYPHNLLLETGFEGGAIGLLLLALALGATMLASLRSARNRDAMVNLAIILTVCVVGVNVLVSGTYAENRLMYLVLGLTLAAPSIRATGDLQ